MVWPREAYLLCHYHHLSLNVKVSLQFRSVLGRAGVDWTTWLRTTEPRHARAVAAVWRGLQDRGDLYRDT